MWQSEGGLIQIEVGWGVIKAFTKPDQRGLIKHIYQKPPEEGKVFREIIQQLRDYLQEKEGIFLPKLGYRCDNQLEYNEVRVYFGLEVHQFKIEETNELFIFLIQKLREYNMVSVDKDSIESLLLDCFEAVTQDNYQCAFKKYSMVYYHSFLQRYEFEIIQSLSDAGSILLKSGDLLRAFLLFDKAFSLCDNPSIIDPIIKLQVYLNIAETLKTLQKLNEALYAYMRAAKIAFYSGRYSHLFLALINVAESQYLLGNYKQAIFTLEQADALILEKDMPNFQISRNIQKSISGIKDTLLLEQTQEIKALKEQKEKEKIKYFFKEIVSETFSIFAKCTVQAFIYKSFGVKGSACFAVLGRFDIKNSTFINSQVGTSNIMKIEGMME